MPSVLAYTAYFEAGTSSSRSRLPAITSMNAASVDV